jgi:hypothetical protein
MWGPQTVKEPLSIDKKRVAARDQVGNPPDPRLDQRGHDGRAITEETLGMGPDAAGLRACGVGRTHQGSGNNGRFDPKFVERFEHNDVRKPARAARAKCKRNRGLRLPDAIYGVVHQAPRNGRSAASVPAGSSSATK